jgi:two-component system, response regulator PdtaR
MKTPNISRILVVEDENLVAEVIQSLLEEMGFDCIGKASSGTQAKELAKILKPDLILMDIALPELDGLTATRWIQEHCPTPVVVLTAYDSPELSAKASAAGAGAYLTKPPSAPEMDRAISIAVARFHDMMEMRRLRGALEDERTKLRAAMQIIQGHDQSRIPTP